MDDEPTQIPQQDNGTEVEATATAGRIMVEFDSPGSAQASIHIDPNVGPMQVLGAAKILEMIGETMFAQGQIEAAQRAAASQRIIVPQDHLPKRKRN